jgi:hypothetical protein
MPTAVPNPCDSLEVDLSRIDLDVEICQQPCIDIEITHPDMVIEIATVANQGPKGDKGDTGEQGNIGPPGSQGAPGVSATVTVGTTTTGAPGSAASVTDSDPSGSSAVLNFAIPAGLTGATGPQGQGILIKGTVPTAASLPSTGNTNGDLWIALDTGHGWAWNGSAWVDTGPIQGPPGAQGPQGLTGPQGNPGAASTVPGPPGPPGAASTVPGPPGTNGIDGAPGSTGPAGTAATATAGTTTTGAPGTAANVVNTGSSSAAIFAFMIPRGDVGAAGSSGANGAAGVNAFTTTTADFVLPTVGSTVSATVADASWIIVGQMLWADGGAGAAYALQVTAKAGNTLTLLNSGGQVGVSFPYDVGLYAAGKPAASAILMRFVFNRVISTAINLAGSVASLGTAPTASAAFSLTKNGSAIGTLNFAAGATSGTFTVAAAQNFVSGDVLAITAPGTADSTLSDLSVTLNGTRT